MKEEINLPLKKFGEAVDRLKEGIAHGRDELHQDGVIQRFEFTFELLWKTLRIFLENKGISVMTPKDSLKAAFKIELIQDDEAFLQMLQDRNLSSHLYSKEEAAAIFQRIKTRYLPLIENLQKKIRA